MDEALRVEDAVMRVLAGDREAYRPIVDAYEVNIRLLLAGMLPSRDLVDDLTQEVFVHAYLHLGDYTPGTSFLAWIRAVAWNLAQNARRNWYRHAKRTRPLDRIDELLGPEVETQAPAFAASAAASLQNCLSRLTDQAQALTRAYYFAGESSGQIAVRYDRTDAWVRLVLHRARIALSKCLERAGATDHAER